MCIAVAFIDDDLEVENDKLKEIPKDFVKEIPESEYDVNTVEAEFDEEDLNGDREDDANKNYDNKTRHENVDEVDDTGTAVDKSSDPQFRRIRSRFIRG
ncbi:hypothetical protein ACROYT_G024829 [Oculina patagonica]